jgi:hypothetical protein
MSAATSLLKTYIDTMMGAEDHEKAGADGRVKLLSLKDQILAEPTIKPHDTAIYKAKMYVVGEDGTLSLFSANVHNLDEDEDEPSPSTGHFKGRKGAHAS